MCAHAPSCSLDVIVSMSLHRVAGVKEHQEKSGPERKKEGVMEEDREERSFEGQLYFGQVELNKYKCLCMRVQFQRHTPPPPPYSAQISPTVSQKLRQGKGLRYESHAAP